jgi:hypothetical protein
MFDHVLGLLGSASHQYDPVNALVNSIAQIARLRGGTPLAILQSTSAFSFLSYLRGEGCPRKCHVWHSENNLQLLRFRVSRMRQRQAKRSNRVKVVLVIGLRSGLLGNGWI